jgi:hypothetical protein
LRIPYSNEGTPLASKLASTDRRSGTVKTRTRSELTAMVWAIEARLRKEDGTDYVGIGKIARQLAYQSEKLAKIQKNKERN